MRLEDIKEFYSGKKVFITGHTGFKGSWLCRLLIMAGAEVYGYALEAEPGDCAFKLLGIERLMHSYIGDVRDFEKLYACMKDIKPEYVFHLAAQPIVRESYKTPRETFETNVMGTVNVLECIRRLNSVRSFLNVTTDKVYENNDIENHAFKEDEKLDGYDPYSNSKSCSELVTHSYKKSFFADESSPAISTARAGNVIGGGDFAADRIVPDCVRAAISGNNVNIRNPYSTRPYQHVLEPLAIYLMIAMRQEKERELSGCYNVGPDDEDCISTGELADLFTGFWGEGTGWNNLADENAPHEASFLKLDCSKLKNAFAWKPVWHIERAVKETADWYKAWHSGRDMDEFTGRQIRDFFA